MVWEGQMLVFQTEGDARVLLASSIKEPLTAHYGMVQGKNQGWEVGHLASRVATARLIQQANSSTSISFLKCMYLSFRDMRVQGTKATQFSPGFAGNPSLQVRRDCNSLTCLWKQTEWPTSLCA